MYRIHQITVSNVETSDLSEFPEVLSELVPSKQISALELTFEILTCVMILAVVLYLICCLNVTRLLCRDYLARPPMNPDQEQNELNDISIN